MPVINSGHAAFDTSTNMHQLNEDLDGLQARFEAMANFSSFADVVSNLNFISTLKKFSN